VRHAREHWFCAESSATPPARIDNGFRVVCAQAEKRLLSARQPAANYRFVSDNLWGTRLADTGHTVNIRFTSSLTDHDENMIAPALLNAVTNLLDMLPIAYVIRIDTSDSNVYQHARPLSDAPSAVAPGGPGVQRREVHVVASQ